MQVNKVKYLEKYLNDSKQTKKDKKALIKIHDEEEVSFTNLTAFKQDDLAAEKAIWKEINEEENEDELIAIQKAVEEKETKLTTNKRRRHDSDTESELDELLNDAKEKEEEDTPQVGGLMLEFKQKPKKIRTKDESLLKKERENQKKQTVYRDEKGRKVDKSETKEMKKKELEKVNYENLSKWGKGIIQKEEKERKREEMRQAREQPFARYDIDTKTEEEFKEKQRFDDPMKKILNLHKYEKGSNISSNQKERVISRGFLLPNCKFGGTPNRFGIQPGYRWDGVDRSTGFENKFLSSVNTRKAKEEEYHKLRTEDM